MTTPTDPRGGDSQRRPWFRRNRGGVGMHPATWQGWVILLGAIAVVVAAVVLIRVALL